MNVITKRNQWECFCQNQSVHLTNSNIGAMSSEAKPVGKIQGDQKIPKAEQKSTIE